MTTQHIVPRPTRRNVFSGTVALAALATTGAVAASPQPDAELIAIGREATILVAEFNKHTAAFFGLADGHPDLEEVAALADPAAQRLDDLIDRALELTATTAEGYAAKAVLLRHQVRVNNQTGGELYLGGVEQKMAWSLAGDLIAGRA